MPKPRKLSGKATLVIALAIFALIVALYAARLPDRIRGPWAFGDTPLVGTWSGEVVTPTGARLPALLLLRQVADDGGRRPGRSRAPKGLSRMEGELTLCEGGRKVGYTIDGQPKERSGRTFAFFSTATAPHDGTTPGWFNAAWDGKDAIAGTVQFSHRRGTAAISGPDYPDTQGEGTLTLRRAPEALWGCSSPLAALAATPGPLAYAGPVTDAAGMLDAGAETRLLARVEEVRRATGTPVVVVTAPSLGGKDVAAFTRDLANRWFHGGEIAGDGVIVLLAPKEGKVRIAVSQRLEARLTSAESQAIIDGVMLKRFWSGDYAEGLDAGVQAIGAALGPAA